MFTSPSTPQYSRNVRSVTKPTRARKRRSRSYPVIVWDVEKIVDAAGGVNALRDLLQDRVGSAPGQTTISMWLTRGSIPSSWLGAILFILLSETRQSVFKFLRTTSS